MDNYNEDIFKRLRNYEAPVDEMGWQSIVQDVDARRRLVRRPWLAGTVLVAVAATVAIVALMIANNKPQQVNKKPNAEVAFSDTLQTASASDNVDISVENVGKNVLQSHGYEADDNDLPINSIPGPEDDDHGAEPLSAGLSENIHQPVLQAAAFETQKKEVKSENVISSIPAKVQNSPSEQESDVVDNMPENIDDPYQTPEEYTPYNENTEEKQFFIPSAFTPNGDGLNDIFYVNANFEPRNYEIAIMSRGGDLVFHNRDFRIGWDGKIHGTIAQQGVYLYIIRYKDEKGEEKKVQGQILLLP